MIEGVVAPLDHTYVAIPAVADNVTLPPVQNVVGPDGVIVAVGAAAMVTVCEALAVHPGPEETETV